MLLWFHVAYLSECVFACLNKLFLCLIKVSREIVCCILTATSCKNSQLQELLLGSDLAVLCTKFYAVTSLMVMGPDGMKAHRLCCKMYSSLARGNARERLADITGIHEQLIQ